MSEIVWENQNSDVDFAPSVNQIPKPQVDVDLAREFQRIPDKMAFKIGEVAEIAELKAYVLRYWETEFKELRPQKSKHNQRMYTRRDVETVLLIKKLLYNDRYSIEGARGVIGRLRKDTKKVSTVATAVGEHEQIRDEIHGFISEIQRIRGLFS